jgi:hypothetical protein
MEADDYYRSHGITGGRRAEAHAYHFQLMKQVRELGWNYEKVRDTLSEFPEALWLKENHPLLHYKAFRDKSVLADSFLNTEYRLNTGDSGFFTITKTAHDYAVYLLENDLIKREADVC